MRFRDIKKNKHKKLHKSQERYTYAKTTDRIKAFITDMFMIYIPILYLITYVFMGGKDAFQESNIAPFLGVMLYGIIYSIFLSRTGQTPGKKAYGIKVVDQKSGNNLSFLKAYLRFIVFLFSSFTLLGLLVIYYNKDKKSLHDIVCGSVVVVAS